MPWKPGQSGNPKGRPRGTNTIAHIMRQYGLQPAPPKPKKAESQNDDQPSHPAPHPTESAPATTKPPKPASYNERLIEVLWELAVNGDLKAAQIILSYAIGLPARVQPEEAAEHPPIKTYVTISPDDWPG